VKYWQSLKKTLDQWARQTGFIQRKKILQAFDFLALMTVGQLGMKHPSLAGMVEAIKNGMSREGMHRRFSDAAVAFMKKCSEFILVQKTSAMIPLQTKLLQHFNRLLIFDSTGWDINSRLKDVLPGSGGGASIANCKLQVCYEYKMGELKFFDIQPGIVSDNSYTSQLSGHVQLGDLLLIDLGYFRMKTFCQIASKGAFFLSRLLITTKLISADTLNPIDLPGLLKKVKQDIYQMHVIMGAEKKTQVPCRLVCMRVSQDIATERRRKLKRKSRERGNTISQQHLILADWTLMVTNVPTEVLPSEMVRSLYTLRWQIELLFKQIKSVLCVHKSTTGRENRLRCEIYGKLIMAVMLYRTHADINIRLWNGKRKELSMEKLFKRIQERAFIILDLLLTSLQKAIDYLQAEIPRLIKNCIKLHYKSRRTTLEIIDNGPRKDQKIPTINVA